MFPIGTDQLSISEIAKYWSREIMPPASKWEIAALLQGAWWRGEVIGIAPVDRLECLKRLFKLSEQNKNLGVVFIAGNSKGPPEIKEFVSGDAVIDLRPRIRIPSTNIAKWNEKLCREAFDALGSSPEAMPDVIPALSAIKINRAEFKEWIAKRGYACPTFWGNSKKVSAGGILGKRPRIKAYLKNTFPKGVPAPSLCPRKALQVDLIKWDKSLAPLDQGTLKTAIDEYNAKLS